MRIYATDWWLHAEEHLYCFIAGIVPLKQFMSMRTAILNERGKNPAELIKEELNETHPL